MALPDTNGGCSFCMPVRCSGYDAEGGEMKDRFIISDKGIPLFADEYETHIKDLLNDDITIVVKNGYCGEDDTSANEILNILNGKAICK